VDEVGALADRDLAAVVKVDRLSRCLPPNDESEAACRFP
jgi:hypothetical protein